MGQRYRGMDMPQIRCNNRTVIDGLEWYCNAEKGHTGDHEYRVLGIKEIIAKRWKQ